MVFRHVEALIENGFKAVVATTDGQSPNWFKTTAPVVPLSSLAPGPDILVFPENNAPLLRACAEWANPKVVFCQNEFMTHRGLDGKKSYADYGVNAIISVGWTSAWNCRRRFADLSVHIVPNFVDPELFSTPGSKGFQIVYSPAKRLQEAQFIRDLFRANHPQFRQVPWLELGKLTEAEVAKALGHSAVFLSLCRFEASPLLILEAMSCGCIIAGFTGLGARDFTTVQNGFWAQEDDCHECTALLVRACRLVGEGGPFFQWMVDQAMQTASTFARPRFVKALLAFWQDYINQL